MKAKHEKKGVIFDLDGTLLNTLVSLANCFNRVLDKNGYPVHEVNAYRSFIGDGARICMKRCLPIDVSEAVVDSLLAQQQIDYQNSWQTDVTIYDGILDCLEGLKTVGIATAVLTNKDHPFALKCVDAFFDDNSFSAVQGYENNVPHKPNPKGAAKLLDDLGLTHHEVLLVGDTSVDIETAHNTKMESIGVVWGFRGEQELKHAGATYIIDHPLNILECL